MANPTDEELIEEIQQNTQKFSVLYERYVDRIYSYLLRRTNNKALAQDLTSVTFEAAFKNIKDFKIAQGGVLAWLYRVAGNKLKNHLRRQKFLAPLSSEPKLKADFDLAASIEKSEEEALLLEAFSQLSHNDQMILTLRFFENLRSDQVAIIIGCSKDTLYVRIHRALKRLHRHYRQLESKEDHHG